MPNIMSMEPLASGAHSQIGNEGETAIFIGPKKSFSKTVLRNVELEIDEIDPVRVDNITTFNAVNLPDSGSPCLIVVDASLLEEERDKFQRLLEQRDMLGTSLEPPGIVLAYMHDSCVQKVFASFKNIDGLQGVLPMNQSIDIWLAVMRLLLSGGTYFPADVIQLNGADSCKTVVACEAETSDPVAATLTQREIAVMEYVRKGLQNKQIAEKLKVSEHTIKLHIHHVITKLKVSNRTAAAMKFVQGMQH